MAAAADSGDSMGSRRAADGPRLYEVNGERRAFPELHRQRSNTKLPPKVIHLNKGRGGVSGMDTGDEEVPLRVRWRADESQSATGDVGEGTAGGEANGERSEGSSKRPPYRLPPETKEQLRSVIRQVSLVRKLEPPLSHVKTPILWRRVGLVAGRATSCTGCFEHRSLRTSASSCALHSLLRVVLHSSVNTWSLGAVSSETSCN